MIKNAIKQFLRRIRISNYYSIAANNKVRYAWDAKITLMVVGGGAGNQILIDDTVITRKLRIIVRGNNNRLIIKKNAELSGNIELVGDNNTIVIGERTTFGGAFLMAHHGTNIAVGNDCLFSGEVDIRTSDSHSIFDDKGMRINADQSISIGDRVWLGRGVSVMKGSLIGHDVVVGAMSLVTKAVPNNCVVAGVPARIIKHNITWSK